MDRELHPKTEMRYAIIAHLMSRLDFDLESDLAGALDAVDTIVEFCFKTDEKVVNLKAV